MFGSQNLLKQSKNYINTFNFLLKPFLWALVGYNFFAIKNKEEMK